MSRVVLVDSRVDNLDIYSASFSYDTRILFISPHTDGLSQITGLLSDLTDIHSLHIISHGTPGSILLGSGIINESELTRHNSDLVQIGKSLSETGDILLYGCNVGMGDEGTSFVRKMAELTGADVAASTDISTNIRTSGNLLLENVTGNIESRNILVDAQIPFAFKLQSINGDSGDNNLTGTDDNDSIYGFSGDDIISGKGGDDLIDGGEGYDIVSYEDSSSGTTVNLETTSAQDTVGSGRDTILNIEKLVGSNFDDTLAGREVQGLDGNDIITSIGNGMVYGGNGNDTISGSNISSSSGFFGMDEYLYGDAGDDSIAGNDGRDYISGGDGIDNLHGGEGNDSINGDDGNDFLYGDAGDDYLRGGNGDDVISGGDGSDTAGYYGATAGVHVDLSNTNSQDTKGAGSDTLSGIENLDGSEFDDTLTGSDQSNRLYGGLGSDTLFGGAGDDFLAGSSGDDFIDGGDGTDTVYYYGSSSFFGSGTGVSVDLSDTTSQHTGSEGYDTLSGVENIEGTPYDDVLAGDSKDNRLDGRGGNDILKGREGDDVYVFWGLNDHDTVDNSDSNVNDLDTIYIPSLQPGDIVLTRKSYDLVVSTQDMGCSITVKNHFKTDSIDQIEFANGTIWNKDYIDSHISGSGFFLTDGDDNHYATDDDNTIDGLDGDDSIHGLGGNDYILGGSGKDDLYGDGGNDILAGGNDDDFLAGGDGLDTASYDDAPSGVTVNLNQIGAQSTIGAGTDTLLEIENLKGSSFNDILTGPGVIEGNDGDDTITGTGTGSGLIITPGSSSLFGGRGNDIINGSDFSNSGLFVSDYDERLYGDSGDDSIYGNGGRDYVSGGDGNDILQGGTGNDFLMGGEGDDYIDGGEGNDTASYSYSISGVKIDLNLPGSQNTIGSGTDTLVSIEYLVGSEFDDELYGLVSAYNSIKGGDGNDLITGGNDADSLHGNGGNDALNGGSGDDRLLGGAGDDIINGGDGVDHAAYYDSTSGVTIDMNFSGQQETGGSGKDTLISIEGLIGSEFNDNLTGGNWLEGRGGDDTITGGGTNDQIYGESGSDVLYGGGGDDLLYGGDSYSYSDTSTNILNGGEGNDRLDGDAGNDTLVGGIGNDTYVFGSGAGTDIVDNSGSDITDIDAIYIKDIHASDIILGKCGNDLIISVIGKSDSITVRNHFTTEAIDRISFNDGTVWEGDVITSKVIRVYGTDGNDSITGTDADDYIEGRGGNDNIRGLAGNDQLSGGDGNDSILANAGQDMVSGGAGDDFLDGGEGIDTAYYFDASSGVEVNLDIDTQQDTKGAGHDTLINIENISGSTHDDILTGPGRIFGNAGNDRLISTGNASIEGGAGNDTIIGSNSSTNYGFGMDEYLYGDAGDDIINGNAGRDYIGGGEGNDSIDGGAGNDALNGGDGDDIISGGDGIDLASYYTPSIGVEVDLRNTDWQDTKGAGIDKLSGIENLSGSSSNDVLTGDSHRNSLYGDNGDDILYGNEGDDSISGGHGDDLISGGEGVDEAAYYDSVSGVEVDLTNTDRQDTKGAGNDKLSGIENLNGSQYDDRLTGDYSDNVLKGWNGNDILSGGGGNDTLSGGSGNDIIEGGEGNDTALYIGSWDPFTGTGSGSTVDLNISGPQNTNSDGFDALSGIENIIGSSYGDTLSGNDSDNRLDGSYGNDLLKGRAGNDVYVFGQYYGKDVIDNSESGATDSDSIYILNLLPSEIIIGRNNDDLVISVKDRPDTLTVVNHFSSDPIDQITFNDGTIWNHDDINSRIKILGTEGIDDITGTAGNDLIEALGGDDVVHGLGGDDRIFGGKGLDTLDGGEGDDLLDGGEGYDFADYSHSSSGVTVNLDLSVAQDTVSAGFDKLVGIEAVNGSAYNDTLSGGDILNGLDGDDSLKGNDSDNHLSGGAGNDNLSGGAGNDFLWGSSGNDIIDGGEGIDTVIYDAVFDNASGKWIGARVDLAILASQDTVSEGRDKISGIENILGSSYSDNLSGDSGANKLDGRGGDDILSGREGDDHLLGGDGDDALIGGSGDDILNGGNGSDTAIYDGNAAASLGVTVNLSITTQQDTQSEGLDTLISIENIIGSDFDDVLSGNSLDNSLFGGKGNDSLTGGVGNDVLSGGEGNDTADYSSHVSYNPFGGPLSGVTVDLSKTTAQNTVVSGLDTLSGIENVSGTRYSDTLYGNSLDNIITGNAGDDRLFGDLGNDVISGGEGADTLLYSLAASGVNVDLNLKTSQDTLGAGSDTITGVENLSGSLHDDTLTGDAQSNILDGDAGNDSIIGGDGDDIILGGLGNDVIDGGAGFDTASYKGSASGVTVRLGVNIGQDTIGAGSDTLINMEGLVGTDFSDMLSGNDLNNTIQGESGDDVIRGGSGDDSLYGGKGGDSLYGEAGNDFVIGGSGDDFIDGGDGNDTVSYSADKLPNPFDGTMSGVNVNLSLTGAQNNAGYGSDTLVGVENIIGSSYGDKLTGNELSNRLEGLGGNDVITGGLGDDYISGGEGTDTAVFTGILDTQNNTGTGVNVDLSISTSQNTGEGVDTLSGIENLTGSDYGDTLTGDESANVLDGRFGNDLLKGNAGNDTYVFGAGYGKDVIDNSGSDSSDLDIISIPDLMPSEIAFFKHGEDLLVTVKGLTDSVTVKNHFTTGAIDRIEFGDGSFMDQIAINSNLAGSIVYLTEGNDNYQSDYGSDVIYGLGGNDKINGLSGDDKIYGDSGDDILEGGTGNDSLDGGDGEDKVSYIDATDGVTVNLDSSDPQNTIGAGIDTLINMEHLIGSSFNDVLTGPGNIQGLDGNDIIHSSGSGDISGGDGNDELNGSNFSRSDMVFGPMDENLSGDAGDDFINGNRGRDLIHGGDGQDILDGGTDNDIIYGDGGNDGLFGRAGDDILNGGDGDDAIEGGEGNDTAVYIDSSAGVSVDLNLTAFQNTVGAGYDKLIEIEHINGSEYNDTLKGNSLDNNIEGGSGDDRISGGAGNDILTGGNGNDIIDGGEGIDTAAYYGRWDSFVSAGTGVSVDLSRSDAQDTGAEGIDTLSGIENLSGSSYEDILSGDSLSNRLDGHAGNDLLKGGGGNDVYVFGFSYDHDVVDNSGADVSDVDTIYISDVEPDLITLDRNGDDLVISINEEPDTLTVKNHFGADAIEQIQFSDGTLWNSEYIAFRTTPPEKPDLSASSDLGLSDSDNITNKSNPDFSGTATAGYSVKLYDTDGATVLGSTTADISGNWSISSSALSDGVHTISIKVTDGSGFESMASDGLDVTIDTVSPAPPVALDLSNASDTGSSDSDNITNYNGAVKISGTAEAGSIVELFDGTVSLGTITADPSGDFTMAATLSDGTHSISAKASDIAGNVSVASSGLEIIVDQAAPVLDSSHSTPVDDASGVNLTASPQIEFSENIAFGQAGTIELFNVTTNTVVETFDISTAIGSGDGQVTISGKVLALNPASDFALGNQYAIRIEAGAVTDLAGNDFAGITNDTDYSFTADIAPVIISNGGGATAAVNVAENTTAVTTVTSTDPDPGQITLYSITGGADASKFSINTGTGVLTFKAAPDFENPQDTNIDNIYVVEVTANDANGGKDLQAISVTVTGVNETVTPPPQPPSPQPPQPPVQDPNQKPVIPPVTDWDKYSDIDDDGIPETVEKQVPGLTVGATEGTTGDGNGDGIQDTAQPGVSSIPFEHTSDSGETSQTFITLVGGAEEGKIKNDAGEPPVVLREVHHEDAPADLPSDVSMPFGMISFEADAPSTGSPVSFSIYVDGSVPVNGYWKQDNSGNWVNLASSAMGGQVVTEGGKTRLDFVITDGGAFDKDGRADGVITDPGAPGWRDVAVTFNEDYYLQSKLSDVRADGYTNITTVQQVKSGIINAGMTVLEHFERYSLVEGTSPSELFNTHEYLEGKAHQLNRDAISGKTDWTASDVQKGLSQAGFTNAFDHFSHYGWLENVNPSSKFDVSDYLSTKAGISGVSETELKNALKGYDLDPLTHYVLYGQNEAGITARSVSSDEIAGNAHSGRSADHDAPIGLIGVQITPDHAII